jgi:hypothetical protein
MKQELKQGGTTVRITRLNGFLASVVLASVVAVPAPASAQYRGPQSRYYDSRVGAASLRVNFQPTDADVYVDGALAGRVADFDGIFQRLHLLPGNHVITISRAGFRAERHTVNLRRNGSETITGRLEPAGGYGRNNAYGDRGYNDRGNVGRSGTVTFNAFPSDAQIWVNGSRRSAVRRGNAYVLDLEPGRHRIEVRRNGYAPYTRDVDVRAGAALSLNLTWKR